MSAATANNLAQPNDGISMRGVSSAADSVYPEQVIGSYVIGKTVGRGSFGKVKRGRHLHTGEPVAIKILNREKLRSAHMDRKIHREIEILQLFSHPNICRLYEVISTPTDMYLIMEFIEGGELYDYIVQKGRVREAEARYIFQQIVCALEYCHHFRVVHRDLKPENILLGPGLQVKLIDFGLSNIMRDGEFLATSCGSPNYAAPEVISGKLYFGPEVDVWSCGVILYALLCGCLPFDEDSIPLLFSKIKKGKYSIPSTMPSGARALIQQVLLVDPLVRLTIPQIRDDMWFNQKLPMRLAFNESLFVVQEDRIISVLASETAKRLSMREKDVRRELERGQGPAYIAYNILLDARRKKEVTLEARELGVTLEDAGGTNSAGIASGAGSGAGSTGAMAGSGPTPQLPGSPARDAFRPQAAFEPKAMERELNMGLMLSPSPAMESMFEHGDATANKATYNTGTFIPASAQAEARLSGTPTFPGGSSVGSSSAPPAAGAFSMKKKSNSPSAHLTSSFHSPSSFRGGGSGAGVATTGSPSSLRRTGLSTSAASQLGASLTDQPRVGSVARKHPMYTSEEETFFVENNCGWRVGLMTDWHAERAFRAVYATLKAFGMQWKVLSPFRIMARTTSTTWRVMDQRDRGLAATAGPSPTGSPTRGLSTSSSAPIPIGGSDSAAAGVGMRSRPMAVESRSRSGAGGGGGGGTYFTDLDPASSESSPLGSPNEPFSGGAMRSPTVVRSLPLSVPPSEEVVMCLHLFRIHERHDRGFVVDFSVRKNVMVGMDVVYRLSDDLIRQTS